MADKQNTHYISAKESRDIARSNRREIRRLQKLRKTYRRADCVTQMKDPRNVVEFDDLHTACPSTFRRARRSASWVSPVAANP